jgi:hypothetical protein
MSPPTADAATCPMHAVIEHDIAHQASTLDDHEHRIRTLEKSDRLTIALVSLAAAFFSAGGAMLASYLKGG